jgi:uncharacterized protein
MRKVLRLMLLFVVAFMSAQFAICETLQQVGKPAGYVNDYAGLFSQNAKTQMETLCVELHDETKAQIFVVTIKTLDGTAIEQFANNLFHTWKIGEKKTDRGILLIFAQKEHKYRYEVGYGFEGILNDAKVGDFGRAMVPDLKAGNYDDAARLGLREVAQVVADDAKVEIPELQPADDANAPAPETVAAAPAPEQPQISTWDIVWPFALFFSGSGLLMFLFYRFVLRRGGGSGSGASSSSWGDSSSSFSDSSSSSDSFSGGDGGDSGGGGASGDW